MYAYVVFVTVCVRAVVLYASHAFTAMRLLSCPAYCFIALIMLSST